MLAFRAKGNPKVQVPVNTEGTIEMKRAGVLFAVLLPVVLAVPLRAQSQPDFKFTKIDLELLHQADQLDEYFARNGMVFEDEATQKYVESVGVSVLPAGDPPEHVTWKFRVLRDPFPNAFALPNGSVYIHTGLLSLMRSEAQLAGVLGHEETHVLNRHPYLEYRSTRKKMVAINIFAMAGGMAGGYGYGTPSLVIAGISSVAPALLAASVFGYSRELEREADMRGLAAMEKDGYDPQEMVTTFRLLERSEGPDSGPGIYSDHPRLEARIQYLTEEIKKDPPTLSSPLVGAGKYSDATGAAFRHDIGLQIRAVRPRHAVAIALHLTDKYPTSEHYMLLGEAYRALGGRPQDLSDDKLSAERKEARKHLSKMTPEEYEKTLLTTPEGKAAWEENRKQAEDSYREAIRLDASNAKAHRGLGFILDGENKASEAAAEFRSYLSLAPTAWDRAEIQKRLDALEPRPGAD
ncbi:MAG TPA: M48 family metalloprotease [Candidatus Acidoferrales bacterium]|nr:M48 family metalloprotease [Candidatus Acidoferrales bacterium]HEV2342291.1 M48 family metalloprotease [Candidatus Acidoferrales bacterium]